MITYITIIFTLLILFVFILLQKKKRLLADQMEMLGTLNSSAQDAIILIDNNGSIIMWNEASKRIFGYNKEEALGKELHSLLAPGKYMEDYKKGFAGFKNTGKGAAVGKTLELTALHKNGKVFPIELSVAAVKLKEKWCSLGIVRDITERKKVEEELEKYQKNLEALVEDKTKDVLKKEKIMQSLMEDLNVSRNLLQKEKAELTRSNKELEEFAYIASHDLQEPLRMVASYVGLLEKKYKGQLDKSADEYIEFAIDGAKRMQSLIKDLLEYSRVGTKGQPFSFVGAEAVLAEAIENLKISIKNSNAEISWDPLPKIYVDPIQLGQVFQNIISNAIKFKSNEQLKIKISVQEEQEYTIFSIKDNGIGFDPKYAEKIFNIFIRLHGKKDYTGTGIGLAICKKVVERHQGRIWAESEVGKGSTFYFALPKKV